MGKRARLEAGPRRSPHRFDRTPLRLPIGHAAVDDGHGVVGGVIQHLDLQAVQRIVERGARLDQPLGHMAFVKDRQLHGDARPRCRFRRGGIGLHAAHLPDQPCRVKAVECKPHGAHDIDCLKYRNQHCLHLHDLHPKNRADGTPARFGRLYCLAWGRTKCGILCSGD